MADDEEVELVELSSCIPPPIWLLLVTLSVFLFIKYLYISELINADVSENVAESSILSILSLSSPIVLIQVKRLSLSDSVFSKSTLLLISKLEIKSMASLEILLMFGTVVLIDSVLILSQFNDSELFLDEEIPIYI